jgi:transposase
MGVSGQVVEQLAVKFRVVFPHLDERQRRLLMGAEARVLGHGGVAAVARAAEVSAATVSKGVGELEAGQAPLGRVRRPGGGRKRLAAVDVGLRAALLALVEPDMRGDPMSPLRWTTKSTRKLAAQLTESGHRVSADTVADLLREEGFSLQSNAKTVEGRQHPDRDAQFRYLNERAADHQATGDPVISVDTKKKELVGQFANGGREWRPAGEPVKVNVHDFRDPELGKAIPYGVYDLGANTGWVNVGCDHDTAAFAVESIRRWWYDQGATTYPDATRLMITADAGGSNGYRTRAWKIELAALAAETGLTITVGHLPPGTSKWNKIEHRLFSHITMNWRGRPLTSHEVMVATIAATTSRTGLHVRATLDTNTYPLAVRIGETDMAALPLSTHAFHGDWNYALHPNLDPTPVPDCPPHHDTPTDTPPGLWDQRTLSDPRLTGMPRNQLDALTAELDARHHPTDTGTGRPPKLIFPHQVLATVLHLRLGLRAEPLAILFDSSRPTIYRAFRKITQLLNQNGTTISSADAPPAMLTALQRHVRAQIDRPTTKITSAC